ncbi:MAG: GNAT family N-acetyltransferase [Solirubrobacterales bacterium]
MPGALQFRPLASDEHAAFHRCAATAFHEHVDDELLARWARVEELDRSWVVVDGEEIVGTALNYTLSLSVPGGSLDCAGISWVTVHPTYRRRGILTGLVDRLLDDARNRREPLAALWTSNTTVWGRFGFGPAAFGETLRLPIPGARLREPLRDSEPRPRLVPKDGSAALVDPLYEHVRGERPGLPSRTTDWWESRLLFEGDRQLVLVEDADGAARGYAIYQSHGIPPNVRIEVVELIALDTPACTALWRFLTGLELATSVEAPYRPVDDPLPFLLDDIRGAVVTKLTETLWLRLLDLPRALTERRWAARTELTLSVRDAAIPENDGLWRLQTLEGEGAACTRADPEAEPDIALDVRELSSAYLGGVSLAQMASAGLVEERTDGALAALDHALHVPVAPWAPEHF